MSRTVRGMCCGIAIVGVLGLPARSQAESIKESVSKLSSTDVQRLLDKSAERSGQAAVPVDRGLSIRKGALMGAIIGLAPGLVAGLFINKYCSNEVVGGCAGFATAVGAGSVGIGAGIGAMVAASR